MRHRTDNRQLRRAVHKRDRGICYLCGIDCDEIARRLASSAKGAIWHEMKKARGLRLLEHLWGVSLSGRLSFWDMDHDVPLSEGGRHSLPNLRTLCRKCHARETAQLAARRARSLRQARRAQHTTHQKEFAW